MCNEHTPGRLACSSITVFGQDGSTANKLPSPEVWSSSQFESEASEVDHPVGDKEEHCDNGSYGIELAKEECGLGREGGEGGSRREWKGKKGGSGRCEQMRMRCV